MTRESLTRTAQDFLSEASGAVVLQDGAVTLDLGADEVFDFGGAQQVPAAFVVGGAKYGAAGA